MFFTTHTNNPSQSPIGSTQPSRLSRHMGRDAEGGFTMVELLVVILIIGILAAIAVPVFLNQRKVAVDSATFQDVRNIGNQAQVLDPWEPITKELFAQEFGSPDESGVPVLPVSSGTQWQVIHTPGSGVCVLAWNENGKEYTAATEPATYDADKGGAGRTGGACPTT